MRLEGYCRETGREVPGEYLAGGGCWLIHLEKVLDRMNRMDRIFWFLRNFSGQVEPCLSNQNALKGQNRAAQDASPECLALLPMEP